MRTLISLVFIFIACAVFAQPETINIGTSPNDGTGDPLRTAMQKVNTNDGAAFDSLGVHLDTLQDLRTDVNAKVDTTFSNYSEVDSLLITDKIVISRGGVIYSAPADYMDEVKDTSGVTPNDPFPRVVGAVVNDDNPKLVRISMSEIVESLGGSVTTDFAYAINDSARTIDSVTHDNGELFLYSDSAEYLDELLLDYTPGTIADTAGQLLQAFSDYVVSNNISETPESDSISMEDILYRYENNDNDDANDYDFVDTSFIYTSTGAYVKSGTYAGNVNSDIRNHSIPSDYVLGDTFFLAFDGYLTDAALNNRTIFRNRLKRLLLIPILLLKI
jgi:major membrane immunogen (membrane-anchored lipoprotein)